MNSFTVYIVLLSAPGTIFSSDYPPYQPRPNHIMYAPWREAYDTKISNQEKSTATECALCNVDSKYQHLVVYKGKKNTVILATQPYIDKTGIHLLIVPKEHTTELQNLTLDTYEEINTLTQKLCSFFSRDYYEVCINTNQGKSAGASIPQHHHRHLIIMTTPPCTNLIQAIRVTKEFINLPSLAEQLRHRMLLLMTTKTPLITQTARWHNSCYFCHLVHDKKQDDNNLIIHRGKNTLITFAHYPSYFGEIEVIPYHHTNLETMDMETYKEMNELTRSILPLLMNALNTHNANFGFISNGLKSEHKEHLRQRIIPRKENWITSPITESCHLNGDMVVLHEKLLLEWNNQKAKI